jgi:hypothetical protein
MFKTIVQVHNQINRNKKNKFQKNQLLFIKCNSRALLKGIHYNTN